MCRLFRQQQRPGFAAAAAGALFVPPLLFATAAAAAAGFSLSHLGRPGRAWRAGLNVRRSWLSREVFGFGSFVAVATVVLATGPSADPALAIAGVAVGLLTLIRVVGSAVFPLSGDEAYYWDCSRHLDWTYFDQPPLVIWAMRWARTSRRRVPHRSSVVSKLSPSRYSISRCASSIRSEASRPRSA